MPRVSVVLPVFNGEAFVEGAIQSIQNQTYSDWELLVCDDGSQDGSVLVCDSLAERDARIKVVRNEHNLGLAATMNRLVGLAGGEYCAIQEQDDLSLPQRLEAEVDELDRHPDVAVVSGIAGWMNDAGEVRGYFPWFLKTGGQYPTARDELIRYLYVYQSKIANPAAMVRMALFNSRHLRFDESARMAIDFQFFVDAAHLSGVRGVQSVLVHVRRGKERNSLTSHKALQFQEARRCIRILYDRYRDQPDSPIDSRLYRLAMGNQLLLEARYYGPRAGVGRLLRSLWLWKTHRRAWKTAREFVVRAARFVEAKLFQPPWWPRGSKGD
jgi:glycosyltransferase involved in cell wall biosynthesis